jgi:hypothetical protein
MGMISIKLSVTCTDDCFSTTIRCFSVNSEGTICGKFFEILENRNIYLWESLVVSTFL